MIESWMIDIIGFLVLSVATYAVLRSRVSRLEEDYSDHIKKSETRVKELYSSIDNHRVACESRINTCFTRLDSARRDIVVLQRDTVNLLGLKQAEEKFVSKQELRLHLDKIEIVAGTTAKDVSILMGKQDDILEILRNKL